MRKFSLRKTVIFILFLVCLFTFIISIIHIINWKKDNISVDKIVDDISEVVEVKEVVDENTTIVPDEVPEANPYWDYIKMNLISVDFSELLDINSDTVGWIQVNGTNVNYPVVQYSNNDFYLTHAFNRSYNSAGWIFMDYRNDISSLDGNTIIYGHGRADKIMFGSLKNALTNGWLNNKDNFVIKLSTPKKNTLWQVFSVYRIPTTSDYLRTSIDDDFVNMLINRSKYNFNTSVSGKDHIITLSTCYNDKDKVVIHAKLIKYEDRT